MSLEDELLIQDRRVVTDDGCDYCATFIDNLRSARRARSGSYYQPPVKPSMVCHPKTEQGKTEQDAVVRIGNRNIYSRKVITGVYQLHHSGRTAVQIARMLNMPFYRVKDLLKRGTSVNREIFRRVSTQPLPTEDEIMRSLAADAKMRG